MSSDSAFQSLGDGLELDQEEKPKLRPEPSKLELQMKAIAEEAKKRRLAKGIQPFVMKIIWDEFIFNLI